MAPIISCESLAILLVLCGVLWTLPEAQAGTFPVFWQPQGEARAPEAVAGAENADQAVDATQDLERKLDEALDKQAFIHVLRTLLWDADDVDTYVQEGQSEGRDYKPKLRMHGLLGRKLPENLKNDKDFAGKLYTEIENYCYGLSCRLGLNKFIRQIDWILRNLVN